MRAVVQRVNTGSVSVGGQILSQIGPGLVILLGIGSDDTKEQAAALARKISLLRIFGDEEGKINRSVLDIGGEALVVSQFTLYADTRKGNRPSFVNAAPPNLAEPLVDYFADQLNELGVPVKTGQFGAYMVVNIGNDGPVTIWLEY